jgi:transposase InsO family protein
VFHNVEEVIAAVAVAVEYYNNERPHMSIGMSTPSQASMMQGDRDMKWKNLRQAAN